MEKQKAILQHKIRTIQDKIYDLVQEQKVLQNEFDSLDVKPKIIDSDINSWSEEKRVYFDMVGKLNEPERSEALDNFDESEFIILDDMSISDCLSYGFDWTESKQGFEYWDKIDAQISTNTYKFDKI